MKLQDRSPKGGLCAIAEVIMKRLLCILLSVLLLTGVLGACGAENSSPTETSAPEPSATAPDASEPGGEGLRVYCFAAGKADAFLFSTARSAVIIDTGESGFGKTIAAKCAELGIVRIDCLIITHFDKDHVGGAKKVIDELEIGTVLQSNVPKDSGEYEKYSRALEEKGIVPVTVREGYRFTLDGVTYTVDPPHREYYSESPSNNSSLITTVSYGATRLLFLGDAEDARLSEYLATDPPRCDFVKLPHHGRPHRGLAGLMEATSPRYALITSSDEEPEDPRTRTMLEEYGIQTFLTRIAPVAVFSDGVRLSVQYE